MTTDQGIHRWELEVVTDGREVFLAQIPSVAFHPAVIAALGLPELSMVTVKHLGTGRSLAVWAVSDASFDWDHCPTPWSKTVRLSLAAWRQLIPNVEARSGDTLRITAMSRRFPVWPAHIERLLAGNELGMHKDDATELGIKRWALVNYNEIPTLLRVRLSDEERDRGRTRLSYQARMLLGLIELGLGRPEITVAPLPTNARRRRLLVGEPRWVSPRGREEGRRRISKLLQSSSERCLASVLGAPHLAFRTVEAAPGEDQAITVRIPEELFPLLGTQPGQQVYIEWGPRNRTIATALVSYKVTETDWPSVRMIGRPPTRAVGVPALATVNVAAPTRAAIGVPRVTIVTLRRRIAPLIIGRLNELIIPATGITIGLAADIRLEAWQLLSAVIVIVVLLLAPLRIRRSPRGRVP